MGSLTKQFQHVMRRLSRSPMFTAVTLLTLAIGIGANTAIFSVINGVLIKPLPFRDPDRLVAIWQTAPGLSIPEINASPATYYTYREENRTFEDTGLWRGETVTVTGLAEPEHLESLAVTDGVLPILGVNPSWAAGSAGRTIQPAVPRRPYLVLWLLAAAIRRRPLHHRTAAHGGRRGPRGDRRPAARLPVHGSASRHRGAVPVRTGQGLYR